MGCGASGGDAPGEPPPEPAPSEARFGGALVEVGGHALELVVHASGEVHLHVHGDAELTEAGASVTLPAGEERHAVALRWTDTIQGFTGRLETAAPSTGPARVLLVHEGHRLEGQVTIASLVPEAAHEGSVVHVGAHDVEVVVDPDGHATAWILDDPDHRLDVDLTLNLPGDDGRLHPLSLAWDPELARYVGALEGLHAEPGPLELIAREGEVERLGHGSLLGVEAIEAGGDVQVPDDLQLRLPELGTDLPGVIAVPPTDAPTAEEPTSSPSSSGASAPAALDF